ncbi:hypothetical protein SCHPADRAFT_908369 [Schizopora paradoxa]|uniref:TPR-like protein n=1 Tax=Schizopora paradoxa TaxID=27342 RepID=A0A0H2RBH2_9AGAM|nr:hypothetical protein SCHPADRAFT_908369 [Schizopora paradoxa]
MTSITDTIFAVWDLTPNSAGAQARFAELLSSSTTEFSDVDKAQLQTQLARTLGLQNHFEDAHKLLDEAEQFFRTEQTKSVESTPATLKQSFVVLKMRIELERGRVYNSAGMPEHAEPHFLAACEAAASVEKSAGDQDPSTIDALEIISYLKIDALHMLAIVATSNALRVSYANQGIALARDADRARGRSYTWLGPLLNNLGWDTLEAGDFKNAIVVFQEAAEVRRDELDLLGGDHSGEEGDKRKRKAFTSWKIAVWSVGHAQMQAGKEEDAYDTLTNLLKQDADGPSIREDLTHICLWKAKRSERGEAPEYERMAVEHAKRALELGVDGLKADSLRDIIAKYSNI